MRICSVSGIAGRGDSSLIRPVPDAETLPIENVLRDDTTQLAGGREWKYFGRFITWLRRIMI